MAISAPYQSTINTEQAFGLPGEIYDLTPYRVDARQLKADAVFGEPVGINTNGDFAKMGTGYTKFAGILVRPKEYVFTGSLDVSNANKYKVLAGSVGQIMSMGRVVVTNGDSANWNEGDDIYVTSAGALTKTASITTNGSTTSNTKIAKVVVGGNAAVAASDTKPAIPAEQCVIELG